VSIRLNYVTDQTSTGPLFELVYSELPAPAKLILINSGSAFAVRTDLTGDSLVEIVASSFPRPAGAWHIRLNPERLVSDRDVRSGIAAAFASIVTGNPADNAVIMRQLKNWHMRHYAESLAEATRPAPPPRWEGGIWPTSMIFYDDVLHVAAAIPDTDRQWLAERYNIFVTDALLTEERGLVTPPADGSRNVWIKIDCSQLPTADSRRAVIAHEIAHVRCNHLVRLAAWWRRIAEGDRPSVDQGVRFRDLVEGEVAECMIRWEMRYYVDLLLNRLP
jgi:hypothetical protein